MAGTNGVTCDWLGSARLGGVAAAAAANQLVGDGGKAKSMRWTAVGRPPVDTFNGGSSFSVCLSEKLLERRPTGWLPT